MTSVNTCRIKEDIIPTQSILYSKILKFELIFIHVGQRFFFYILNVPTSEEYQYIIYYIIISIMFEKYRLYSIGENINLTIKKKILHQFFFYIIRIKPPI